MMSGATLAWGASYLFMKNALKSVEPCNLIFLRFSIGFFASALLFPRVFRQCSGRILLAAALLGFLLTVCFFCVMEGLKTTDSGTAGFLLGSTVVWVQFWNALLQRKMPSATLCAAASASFAGIALMTVGKGFTIGTGALFCLLSAFGYSWHILLSGKFLKESPPLPLGVFQFFWTALFSLAGCLIFETPRLPGTGRALLAVLILGLVCTAAGFLLQAFAQSRLDTARIGILFALEPVFAMLLGVLFAGESPSSRRIAGAVCILSAVFLAHFRKESSQASVRS